MFEKIKNKQAKIAVIGLGYVGLPLALEFAKKYSVIGFDIKEENIEKLRRHEDPSGEMSPEDFEGADIEFTSDPEKLAEANFYIVAVPTPIDEHKEPDLKPLLSACETVGKYIKKGDYVVFESTVYPGCTEEDCVPVIEQTSGLKYIQDFKVGYSPERINPGDKVHTLTNVIKITSGCDEESSEEIAKLYGSIVKAGIFKASSIKVAEAAKIIENTQRDVNIALMNELSIIFNKLKINTYEVIDAASTKWNFLRFTPGLVGGHCIGVDPYYLVYKARELGYHPQVITAGRSINDYMGEYVAQETVKLLAAKDKNIIGARVLVMGFTFKENIKDIRNTKVADLIKELQSFKVEVDVVDPYADPDEVLQEYGIKISPEIGEGYNAIIVAVAHNEYKDLTEDFFLSKSKDSYILVDIKGIYRGKIKKMTYWSL